ncbi:MAG: response regulator [Bacteroidetes bacterium]|nr:response regulator [Bacteroidota bacterium]
METKYIIYIVDDDPFNLLLISRKLKKTMNCTTRLFRSALECIHDTRNEKPDIILTDYLLTNDTRNKLNGDYVLQRFKSKYSCVPVIMYSSLQSADLILSLMRKGAADFVLRDDQFLEKITRRVQIHLRTMKQKMSKRFLKLTILATIVAITAGFLYLGKSRPELLIPFSIIWIALFAVILFFKDPVESDIFGDKQT